MVKLANVMLKASQNVEAGKDTSIDQLFSIDEQKKMFEVSRDVARNVTSIQITVAKLGSFELIADDDVKKGKKTNVFNLLKRVHLSKNMTATNNIKKDEKLEAVMETL